LDRRRSAIASRQLFCPEDTRVMDQDAKERGAWLRKYTNRPAAKRPIIEAYDPPEGWGCCYVDEVFFDLSEWPTAHLGPIPRYY
jgi:hypothetical protein